MEDISQHDRQIRIERLEHDHEVHGQQIHEIANAVASLSSDVRSLTDQVRGLFGRANQPTNWGWIVAGIGLIVVFAGLLVAPIKKEMADQQEFDLFLMEKIIEDAQSMGYSKAQFEFRDKMDDRLLMLERAWGDSVHDEIRSK